MHGLVALNYFLTHWLTSTIEGLALVVELGGVIAVLVTLVHGLAPFVSAFLRLSRWPGMGEIRRRLGYGLVLSLEIFVAADLLRTLANPTLQEVIILGTIAFLRTILGLSLEYDLRRLPGTQ